MASFKDQVDQTIEVGKIIITIMAAVGSLVSNVIKTGIGSVLGAKAPTLLRAITGGGIAFEGIGGADAFQAEADYWIAAMNHDLGYA